jgi:hypothetical protein
MTDSAPDLLLTRDDGSPFSLRAVLSAHALTLLLPFRGHW